MTDPVLTISRSPEGAGVSSERETPADMAPGPVSSLRVASAHAPAGADERDGPATAPLVAAAQGGVPGGEGGPACRAALRRQLLALLGNEPTGRPMLP